MSKFDKILDGAKQFAHEEEVSALEKADNAADTFDQLNRLQETHERVDKSIQEELRGLKIERGLIDDAISKLEKIQAGRKTKKS